MTIPMLFVLGLLVVIMVAFVMEWTSPDLVAFSAFCALFIIPVGGSPILTMNEAFSVFSNHAPITIAAMFILTAALEKTGVIDTMGRLFVRHLGSNLRLVLIGIFLIVGVLSAFMNNTPVVAIFMPVLLAFGRGKNIAPSKLLLPLSYAAVLGGCCTLIGTSTNIVVSGLVHESYGLPPLGMFELAWLGVPFVIVGGLYTVLFAPSLLPTRQTITAVLGPDERKQFFCQVLVKKDSPLIGQKLVDTPLARRTTDFRIIEVRREGRRLLSSLSDIIVRPFDRITISASSRQMAELPQVKGITLATRTEGELGIENLSTIQGSIMEGIISPHSRLIGKTVRQINFRQTYGVIILAIHRQGKNLSANFLDERLEFGDTLLMMGPQSAFVDLAESHDFLLLEDKLPHTFRRDRAWVAGAIIAAVVLVSTVEIVPIAGAAIVGCLVAMLARCIDTSDAYQSIDWSIIFLIYGMLGVGLAMEKTHAAAFLAQHGIDFLEKVVPELWLPMIALSFIYILTLVVTEFLSNNATAVVLVPIAVNFALGLQVDPRPFVIAVTLAASAAFATPIGYQTNTMVYGAGGYRFVDYLRLGIPLNIILWVMASFLIPLIWPLR